MFELQWWTLIPFILMLLMIAVAPLFMEKWWEKNSHKFIVSMALGIPTAVYLIAVGLGERLQDQVLFDYLPFIILLCALFVVTGGIFVSGDIEAKPSVNTLFIGIGFILSSLMGTTGSAMLLIRPLINTNKQRHFKTHTILFFIAAVANCGGLLTPLGDPPLFLLYLRGASFTWFLKLFPAWLFTGVVLLVIYYFVDRFYYRRERDTCLNADSSQVEPIRINGKINLLYLVCIILAVAFVNEGYIPAMKGNAPMYLRFLREYVLVAIILLSWLTTKKSIRTENKYSWAPIIEVAFLFVGIFVTMTPALLFLNEHAASLGLSKPWQFFYCTGALSSVLDNAPTAVAFHTVASGLPGVGTLVAGVSETLLEAIAVGAVFFGAMTYIGNGPNFMVKAIAEENKIQMPSFFAYMYKFSLIVLLPIYIVVQHLFF